jgi:hypothetical protein
MDIAKFIADPLSPRTATIPVPELQSYFAKDEKPEWTVRGLSGVELGRIKQSVSSAAQETTKALIAVAVGEGDKAEALRKAMGISKEDTPEDIAYRIGVLVAGSVSPEIGDDNRDVAVKLAEAFPTIFYTLTTKILALTGQGNEVGKPKRSGKTATSN